MDYRAISFKDRFGCLFSALQLARARPAYGRPNAFPAVTNGDSR